jgi:hypothetical protein
LQILSVKRARTHKKPALIGDLPLKAVPLFGARLQRSNVSERPTATTIGVHSRVKGLCTSGYYPCRLIDCTVNSEDNPGAPLPISIWWLECVDDQLSAIAVRVLSLYDRATHCCMHVYYHGGSDIPQECYGYRPYNASTIGRKDGG